MESKLLQVEPSSSGQRLDVYLASALSISRAQAQRWIEEGRVELGRKAAKASLKLAAGQSLSVSIPEPRPMELVPENLPLVVLYQDEHIAVVDKPRGMAVHPSPGHHTGTLVHALLYHLDRLSGIGGVQRPGIVHRLDLTTSGLLVVAKNDAAHQNLSEQFKRRTAGRVYFALAWGSLPKELVVDRPIGRHPTERKRMAIVESGRRAKTTLTPEQDFGFATQLRARLETGRTHQIRVHLAHVGHPVVGDRVYGPARWPGAPADWLRAVQELGGCALHAWRLYLNHPSTGAPLQFEAPVPQDLLRLVSLLRAK